jgi:hypothetical protein
MTLHEEFIRWKAGRDAAARKIGDYWLSSEGRAEIRDIWGHDSNDGSTVTPLLNAVEALEARLAAMEADRDRLRGVCREIIEDCPDSEPTENGRFFSPSVHAHDNAMWAIGQRLKSALTTPADAGECG